MKSAHLALNDNHRRALRSAFKLVERTLEEFERLMEQAGREHTGLNGNASQAVREKIMASRALLSSIRERLGVDEPARVDPVWSIRVGVSRMWEMLEDCKSARIRGYGEVPEDSRGELDSQIQALIDSLEEIARAADGE